MRGQDARAFNLGEQGGGIVGEHGQCIGIEHTRLCRCQRRFDPLPGGGIDTDAGADQPGGAFAVLDQPGIAGLVAERADDGAGESPA